MSDNTHDPGKTVQLKTPGWESSEGAFFDPVSNLIFVQSFSRPGFPADAATGMLMRF